MTRADEAPVSAGRGAHLAARQGLRAGVLVPCGGWLHAQEAGGPGGQPPVPAAEEAHQGWDQQRADHGGVQQDAGAKAAGEDLEVVPGALASEANARNRISAALVTSRPVRPIPTVIASVVEPVRSYSSRMRARMNTS